MYEVELKLQADHAPIRERLADRATHLGTVTQRDTYYDAPHRDFAETDEAVRVRVEEPADGPAVARLTYKGPLVDETSKTREEHETGVDSGPAARAILEGLGFDPAAVVEKNRERYALGEYTITFDTVRGLGEFIEIETEVEDESAVPAARDRARNILSELGLDPEQTVRTSYLGLLLAADEPTDPDAPE
ncbi:class IV adenylate cyclase [Halosegnis sp.]|uniref:class IV adenylate cyclase n=1 Tax=Halosegnis sp. TaxID=2864959 RepID=UPI0035D4126A